MTLERYLSDRWKWQDNTVEHIRERIWYSPNNVVKSKASEKLVAIYGPPQIGKTTLILFLLGIDAKYQRKVYQTLRAGVPRGNSSTSTAIIYKKSENDEYGVKYGEGISEIEYCSEKLLKQRIQNIREKVENEEASKDILHIYIPRRFFNEKSPNCSGINIVDLPGDGSRNIKEKAHADAMINKYMAIATINIITCKANEINSLSELELPLVVDWQNLPHKYIVVITNSYGQGTIKKYFNTKRSERKCPFFDYVLCEYERNLKTILNPLSQIEFFPIDIGDSLERLSKKSGLDEKDSNEVIATTYKMADMIRDSIQKRHGNSLKSTIMDLKAYSSEYAESYIEKLSRKIEGLKIDIDGLSHDIGKKESIVKNCSDKLIEKEDLYSDYIQLKSTKIAIDISDSLKEIIKFVMSKSKNGKIKDNNREILSFMSKELVKFIKLCFSKYGIDDSYSHCIFVYGRIDYDINLEAELVEKYFAGGLISKKIKLEEIIDTLEQLLELFRERLLSIINSIVEKIIEDKKEIEEEYQLYRQLKIKSTRDIERYRDTIKSLESQKASLEKEYNLINLRKNEDMNIIDDYLQIAESEFIKYRDELTSKLDSNNYSVEEKIYILIYLCLLERDYQSIIEMR